jgi:hypothetical protein
MQIDLSLHIPGPLAQEAQTRGLLTPAAMEAMLLAEIRRRQAEELFAGIDRLREANGTGPDLSEITSDIHTLRKAKGDAANRH